MKLLTKRIRGLLPPLYATEDVDADDKIMQVRFFHMFSSWTWFACEGEPVLDDDGNEIDYHFYGWVSGDYNEWGYFALSELESVKEPIPMERDMYFQPKPFKQLEKKLRLF